MYVLMLVNLKWINSIVKHFIMGYVGAIQLLHKYEQGLEHIILILFISVHFRAKWLLYVPPGLTLKNSTFCPHNGFMCFVWIWEQTAIISLTGFYNRDGVCLLRGTDWLFTCNSTFCSHSVFMCFVWIWEQTAIISLCSINWLVFITETECVYCAVRTGSLYIILRSAHTVYLCVLYGS